jgi:acylphosphatase
MRDRATEVYVRPINHSAPSLLKSRPVDQRAAHPVNDTQQAKLFLVSGMVQGVGYRYFAQRVAHQLGIHGYAKNLSDGRVEVYAVGKPEALDSYRISLARGPRSAEVGSVEAEDRPIDQCYAESFSIEYDR